MKRFLTALLILTAAQLDGQTAGPGLTTVYYASKSGATLDCVPLTGLTASGGTCTNNDTVLNGILAKASATNPVTLIMDGGTITNGIVGPSTGYWSIDCQGWGNGFFIASGSNAHVIRNVSVANGDAHWNTTPGTPGQNIGVRNCFINGNRGNGTSGDSNSGDARIAPDGYYLYGVFLDNMAHVLIEHNWFYDEPTFNLTMNSCTDCVVDHNRFDAVSQGVNQDGIHIDGPSAQIRLHDNWFNNSDDAEAANAAEGYGGTIDGVSISNEQCVGCLTAWRQLSDEASMTNKAVRHVVFTNGSGTIIQHGGITGAAFRLGLGGGTLTGTADIMQDVTISNSSYTTLDSSSIFVEVSDNLGELSISNLTWLSPVGAKPFLSFGTGSGSVISSYTCTACRIIRNTTGNAAAWWGTVPGGDSIVRAECNGCSIENEQGQSYSALSYGWDVQSGGSIGTFVMTAMDPALNPTLLNGNEWSRIGSFYGAGVSTYYRNTIYADLPPATYKGLAASIGDSTTQTWGTTVAGGSSSYAQVNSNGTNWTVTGK